MTDHHHPDNRGEGQELGPCGLCACCRGLLRLPRPTLVASYPLQSGGRHVLLLDGSPHARLVDVPVMSRVADARLVADLGDDTDATVLAGSYIERSVRLGRPAGDPINLMPA